MSGFVVSVHFFIYELFLYSSVCWMCRGVVPRDYHLSIFSFFKILDIFLTLLLLLDWDLIKD